MPVQEETRPAYDPKIFYHDEDDDPDTWVPPEQYSPTRPDAGYDKSGSEAPDLTGLDALLADLN